jgi:hypothetical protein
MTRVGLGVWFAAVAASLAMSGCTSERMRAGTPTPEPTPSSASAPASVAPVVPSTSASSTSASATPIRTVDRCHTSDLTGHVEGNGAGAGQRYAVLGLTNKTATTCAVYGYPGLQLVDAQGSPMPTKARRDEPVVPTLVLVKPGQTVWALLHWTVVPAEDEVADHCAPDPAALRVIPPDETTQLSMAFNHGPVCQHGDLSVGPFGRQRPPDG